jgi:CheY-like chemotaxis protein
MPAMTGLELAAEIRAAPEFGTVPILLLSSALSKEHRAAIENHAIAGAFQKPVRQSTLQRALQKLWSGATTGTIPASPAPPTASPLPTRVGRVLIVEDNHINQKLTMRMVEKLGHRAEVAANGIEAIAALDRVHFDLVLMDCQMPEMDGYEATTVIRRREAGTSLHVPIVALTANALANERQLCLDVGMDDYLAKPIRLVDLATTITRWIPGKSNDATRPHGAASNLA